jgi:hypothetical protein
MAHRDQILIRTYVGFWDEAEAGRAAEFAASVEDDPERKSSSPICCAAMRPLPA